MPTRSRTTSSSSRTIRKRLIQPEDLLRMITVSDPRIAPNGDWIAFGRKHINAAKNEGVSNIWVVPTDGSVEARQFTSSGKDSHARWSHDGRTIAFISGKEKGRPQIHLIDAPGSSAGGGESRALTSFPEGSIAGFAWSPDGKRLAVSFREQDPDWTEAAKAHRKDKGLTDPPRVLDDWWYRLDGDGYFNAQRHKLYIVEVDTGTHRPVYSRDTMGHFSFDFSPDSKSLAIGTNRDPRAMINGHKAEILILDIASGKLRPVPNLPMGPKEKVRWSPNGQWIAYAGREGRDGEYSVENLEVWVCNPRTGTPKRLSGKDDVCLAAAVLSDCAEASFEANIQWTPDSRRVLFQVGMRGETHIASVGLDGGRMKRHTRGKAIHGMGSMSGNGRVLAATRRSASSLDEVHVGRLTLTGIKLTRLTGFNDALFSELDVAPITSHEVKAPDGARTHTWVMRPPPTVARKAKGRKRPAIIEIHGGPHAQYGVGFFHEFQMLAANGYVVVFSNPRGSKGYGRDHCAAIRGNWGGADWVDMQAVTRFTQKLAGVDSKRIGIMGGSYGGYMTNWAIGHSNAYKAAITDRCVSNLVSMAGNSDFVDEPDRYWDGNFWDRPETRWAQSPIRYFGTVRTPTLIIHSEGDLRCNIEQAEQVFSALKLLKVPTRLVRYPASTSHGMSRSGPPDMRIHRLKQILGWMKKHL